MITTTTTQTVSQPMSCVGGSDVGLGQYETRAANLLQRLGQLAGHLRQVQANPQLVPPDWCVVCDGAWGLGVGRQVGR